MPHNYVKDVAIDERGVKWFATLGGVVSFDGAQWKTFTSELASDDVWGASVDAENRAWFATTRSVSVFDGVDWRTYEEENGMPEDNSRVVKVDRVGRTWVGTRRGGVNALRGAEWTQYTKRNSGIADNAVWDIDFESLYKVWIGTNRGVSLLEVGGSSRPEEPVAEFEGSPRSGEAPLTVSFGDLSTGGIDSWHWDFGDGEVSGEREPAHRYERSGTYSVSLSVTGPGGSASETKEGYVSVTASPPEPAFSANITEGLAPLTVDFRDECTGCIDTWKYDFDGDGSDDWGDSHSGNTQWTYESAGNYSVRLRVRDCEDGRYHGRTRHGYVVVFAPIPPRAAFSAFPVSGSQPLTVAFTDESTGDVSGWSWSFGDGALSSERNPLHQYWAQGTYTVTLSVSGPAGQDAISEVDLIQVGPPAPPVADFGAAPLSGYAPLSVRFLDSSTGSVTGWQWDFGDGHVSQDKNPVHVFGEGSYTVTLTVSGPLGTDERTREDYITVQRTPPGGSGFAFLDSPNDLDNTHPHLWCKGYGPDNGLWQKAQTTHADIWRRLKSNAPTGEFGGISRNMTHMQTPMAFVISKDPAYGEYSQAMVRQLNGHYFEFGGDTARIAEMETFLSYCLAYDAIVDDPETTWLTAQEKAAALATMAATLERLNLEPSETWRRRPTHNFMALRAAMHAAALYNLRGEAEYEGLFHRSREYALAYHNERVNGLCDAPLQNHGPRPDDGFPYEGSNYSAYQGSRVLVHRHILEMNEYPNPDTVLDENRSGFSRNWNLAWMAVSPPGLSEWADVAYRGDHAVIQAFRYYSALNKAAGNGIAARVGEWFTREVLRSPKSTPDAWWWQGWEMMFYDASIEPLHPDHARLPLYVYLDDSEFHMYRDSWEIADPRPDDTYVYFRNSAHDGHFYWEEGHGNVGQEHECIAETSTHDGPDNGHFGIYKNGVWIAENEQPQGETQRHNCLLIDGQGSVMDGHHDSSDVSELATTDVVGAVDSAYGHALDAVLGGIYTSVDQYNRYVFVIRDPMYVIVVDELDAGHTVDFLCYPGMNITKQGEDLFTSSMARYELMYPQSGFSATGGKPIVITTSSPDVMFLVHPNPSGVSVSKSYGGGQMVAAIGEDEIVYNPAGGRYSRGSISGDATLFAQRSGGRSSSRLPKPQVRSMV